jgi:hypothetical protein
MFSTHKKAYRYFLPAALLLTAALALSACSTPAGQTGSFASIPAGRAYADGQEIYFSHTEASDPAIAEKLTNMMKSPVLLVPSLAQAPDSMLANVYVFQNGIKGKGPLGFQADVFDNPPGSAGYSPLRRITQVTWKDPASASELKSAADILAAEKAGSLTTEKTGVVVNMPFLVWQGGKR